MVASRRSHGLLVIAAAMPHRRPGFRLMQAPLASWVCSCATYTAHYFSRLLPFHFLFSFSLVLTPLARSQYVESSFLMPLPFHVFRFERPTVSVNSR
jgi:hypothetical protein